MHALIHQLARRFALDDGRTQRLWALSGLHRRPDALATHLHRGLAVLAALLKQAVGAGLTARGLDENGEPRRNLPGGPQEN